MVKLVYHRQKRWRNRHGGTHYHPYYAGGFPAATDQRGKITGNHRETLAGCAAFRLFHRGENAFPADHTGLQGKMRRILRRIKCQLHACSNEYTAALFGLGGSVHKTIQAAAAGLSAGRKELTRAEYQRLVTTAHRQGNRRLCLILQTICATGIRVSELPFIAKLADILGHSSIDTTRIYVATTGAEHRRRMENLHLVWQIKKPAPTAGVMYTYSPLCRQRLLLPATQHHGSAKKQQPQNTCFLTI